MINGNSLIALVPMKGHSERVSNKNIRDFNGKPLLYYILNTLEKSQSVAEIYVDTDSKVIEDQVKKYFDKIKIIARPKELCGDFVSMNEIIRYDIEEIGGEYFIQTHATNPLLKASTIDEAFNAFLNSENDSLFSVNRLQTRLYDSNARAINHDPNSLIRTQDLIPVYEENSNIYIFSRESFKSAGKRIGNSPMMYEMDCLEAIDIDNETDFILAETLYKTRIKRF